MTRRSTVQYRALPAHEGGHGFALCRKDRQLATVVAITKSDYEVRVGNQTLRLVTKSDFGVKYQLVDGDGRVLATAQRASAISPRYEIDTAERTRFALAPVATFGRKHHVVRDESIVGFIDPDELMTHDTTVELPEDVPVMLIAFLVWLHRAVVTTA